MKKAIITIIFFSIMYFIQYILKYIPSENFITAILTLFSIFFGFYITSFAVFATSKYLSKLYLIEDEKDNRKTLLDNLIERFQFATIVLLLSIIYLIFIYILTSYINITFVKYLTYPMFGIILYNIFYSYKTILLFIKVTRQSAKNNS